MRKCVFCLVKYEKFCDIYFFRFPTDQKLLKLWLKNMHLDPDWRPSRSQYLCSQHFSKECLDVHDSIFRLRKGSIPTIFYGSRENDSVTNYSQILNKHNPDAMNATANKPDKKMDLHGHCYPNSPREELTCLQVCRVCLSTEAKMYQISSNKFLKLVFERITGIQFSSDDGFPQMLCWECLARLMSARKFIDKALSAQKLLTKMAARKTMNISDIQSVSETRNLFKSTLEATHFGTNDCYLHISDNVDMRLEAEIDGDCDDVEFGIGDDSDTDIPEIVMEINNEQNAVFVNKKLQQKREEAPQKKVKRKSVLRTPKEIEKLTDNRHPSPIIKRKKTPVGLKESLFTVTKLTHEEQIAEVEQRKETSAYKNAPYKCDVCYRGYQYEQRYNVHVSKHSERNGANSCMICKSRYRTARALRRHLASHHSERFSCNECGFLTKNRCVAQKHEKWHAGTKYQCPHCDAVFEYESTYFGHMRLKHVSNFVCELCGYTFVNENGVVKHKKLKHKDIAEDVRLEGPYCKECDIRFLSQEPYDRHLKLAAQHITDYDPSKLRNESQASADGPSRRLRYSIHPRSPGDSKLSSSQGTIACEQCGLLVKTMRQYAVHFQRVHPDKNRTKYTAANPFMCEQCGKVFNSDGLLKAHMWMHGGKKKYTCLVCEKGFTNKMSLKWHQRIHDPALPTHACNICGKNFYFPTNLWKHKLLHTGLKPYKCEICTKCFAYSTNYRAHVDHVHLKKPWPKRNRAMATQAEKISLQDNLSGGQTK